MTDVLPRIELHRLEYSVRGPEWAIAVRQGDIDALDDVMRRCSLFWNGAGTLIVPISADGRINGDIANLRAILDPERCFIHDSVTEAGRQRLRSLFAATAPLRDDFDRHEAHPLAFVPVVNVEAGELRQTIEVPVFASATLQRATLACWGHVADDDLPYWAERFDPVRQEDRRLASRALVAGQLSPAAPSPLLLSRRNMEASHWESPQDWPYLVVLSTGSFEELVRFWNFRARSSTYHPGMPVVGIPKSLLRQEQPLRLIREWLAPVPGFQRSPDLLVNCRPRDLPQLEQALRSAGLTREAQRQLNMSSGRDVQPKPTPTYLPARLLLGGHMIRGSAETALVPIAQRMSLALEPPEQFDLRTGQFVRLTLRNLPLPLPLTASAAVRIHPNGFVSDGLTIVFGATRRYSFDLELPPPEQALLDWAADHGYTARPTQDSRYAQAFLGRLGGDRSLDALATPAALDLLSQLAPESRKKLAQRLRHEFATAGIPVTEESLAERLKGGGVNLELSVRVAENFAGLSRRQALALLAPLVREGFVRRGLVVGCPTCNTNSFVPLEDLAEELRCEACRARFHAPITDAGGDQEPKLAYRLDGLMARVLDQDVLPVILSYRRARAVLRSGVDVSTWPGVEFSSAEGAVDIDLLAYNGQHVYCVEAKSNASSLGNNQFQALLSFCDSVSARPGLAASHGAFDPAQRAAVEERGGLVWEPTELFA